MNSRKPIHIVHTSHGLGSRIHGPSCVPHRALHSKHTGSCLILVLPQRGQIIISNAIYDNRLGAVQCRTNTMRSPSDMDFFHQKRAWGSESVPVQPNGRSYPTTMSQQTLAPEERCHLCERGTPGPMALYLKTAGSARATLRAAHHWVNAANPALAHRLPEKNTRAPRNCLR